MIECEKFLEDKGIKSYIDEWQEGFKDNRLCYGKIKRTTGQQVEQEFLVGEDGKPNEDIPVINIGSKIVLPSSMFWDDMYAVVVCSKSFDDDKPDQDLLL